jgi:transcriptional regulator with XRE-family HTH domain
MTIRAARERMGLSQGKLARMIGCAQASLSRWESGETAPSHQYAEALRELGVDVDECASPDETERRNEALMVEYESTGATLRVLASRHGVHPNTISNRLTRAEDVRRRERIRKGLRA